MSPFKLLGTTTSQLPSIIENPWSLEYIEDISMHCSKSWFSDRFNIHGYVKFKKGNTTSEQEFHADNLGELFVKISRFCEELGTGR